MLVWEPVWGGLHTEALASALPQPGSRWGNIRSPCICTILHHCTIVFRAEGGVTEWGCQAAASEMQNQEDFFVSTWMQEQCNVRQSKELREVHLSLTCSCVYTTTPITHGQHPRARERSTIHGNVREGDRSTTMIQYFFTRRERQGNALAERVNFARHEEKHAAQSVARSTRGTVWNNRMCAEQSGCTKWAESVARVGKTPNSSSRL